MLFRSKNAGFTALGHLNPLLDEDVGEAYYQSHAAKIEGVEIFHAGTVAKDGAILANGGRVLNVCALGATVTEAQARAYQAVDRINWPEGFCRRDIGWQAVEAEKARS